MLVGRLVGLDFGESLWDKDTNIISWDNALFSNLSFFEGWDVFLAGSWKSLSPFCCFPEMWTKCSERDVDQRVGRVSHCKNSRTDPPIKNVSQLYWITLFLLFMDSGPKIIHPFRWIPSIVFNLDERTIFPLYILVF